MQNETKYWIDEETPVFIISKCNSDNDDFDIETVLFEDGSEVPEEVIDNEQAWNIVYENGSEPIGFDKYEPCLFL